MLCFYGDENVNKVKEFLKFSVSRKKKSKMTAKILTLFRMGFSGAAHGWRGWGWGGGAKRPPPSLKSVTHILP